MAPAISEAQQRFVRNLVRFLPLSSALIVVPAWAAKWDIVPSLTAEETYTDNLKLQPDAAKRSDWITTLTPGFSVNATGPKLRLNATYGAQSLYRANESTSALNHQLSASGNAELYERLLFVDARAQVAQQNISLLGPQSQSNVNNTGNRATVSSFLVSPFLRHNFGSDAEGEVRLTYSLVDSGSTNGSADSGATKLDARLSSGPAYKLYRWNVAYSTETIEYSRAGDTTSQKVTVGLQRMVTPNVTSVNTVGYEESNYATIGSAPSGFAWSTGVQWTPTPRTNLTVTTGKRYFGTTRGLNFSHRMRLLVLNASYTEDVTSTRSQLVVPASASTAEVLDGVFLSKIPDPVARQAAVQAFITDNALPESLIVPVEFFTNQFYVSKSWKASVGYQGVRNTVLGNFFSTTRDSQQTGVAAAGGGDFATSSTIKQTGASATWSLRVSERDSSNVSVGYTRSEVPGLAREDNQTYLRMSITHQFEPKLVGALSFRRLQAESNQGGTGTYTENAVTASVKMKF